MDGEAMDPGIGFGGGVKEGKPIGGHLGLFVRLKSVDESADVLGRLEDKCEAGGLDVGWGHGDESKVFDRHNSVERGSRVPAIRAATFLDSRGHGCPRFDVIWRT